jgi:hypothetical protein
MATPQFLNQLFDAHTSDLNEMLIQPKEIFGCPICLRTFTRDAIAKKTVNDGHVWPKSIRKGSQRAANMHVLLCEDCNSQASPGDSQMQLHEKIRRGEVAGELHGARRVQLIPSDHSKPIEMPAGMITVNDDGSFTITGRVDKDGKWIDANPEDQQRFLSAVANKERLGLAIHPPKGFRPEKVPGGWITAAYLMAYYALGYRYILNPLLQPVRKYILRSFEKSPTEMVVPDEETFGLSEFLDKYYEDPLLAFVYPFDDVKEVYLQVCYLKYAIRLPISYAPTVMNVVMTYAYAQAGPWIEELRRTGEPLVFEVPCTKTAVHSCWFDYLMGKPAPISPQLGLRP